MHNQHLFDSMVKILTSVPETKVKTKKQNTRKNKTSKTIEKKQKDNNDQ